MTFASGACANLRRKTMFWKAPRLFRRTLFIFLGAIVAPALALLWLGLQSFDRQRQALTALTAEKLATELENRTRIAAEGAFGGSTGEIAKYHFRIQQGVVVQPLLRTPLPKPVPPGFVEAWHQEFEMNRPDLALESYRKLFDKGDTPALALSGVARCLRKLGKEEESRDAWKRVAETYPDERDLSNRPFGIVGLREAGETNGLYEQIASGRWDLSAEQAEYFLKDLDPDRTTPYLERFRFGRELAENFLPNSEVRKDQVYAYTFGGNRIFYRAENPDVISGFLVDEDWVRNKLEPQLEKELGFADAASRESMIYAAAVGLLLIVLFSGVALLLRDVSREKKMNQLQSDFVSGVSHELKTPITLIRLYSETLLGRPDLRSQERTDFTRIILRESARLTKLVDQILAFSRVERGDHVFNFEEGDPTRVFANVVEDYREYMEHAGFTLEHIMPDRAPAVRYDAAALSQAVVNLLDNAVKYSGDARSIAARMLVSEAHVTFEVEDRGPGIPQSEHQKIFDRFYRVPNGTGKGGYGLGLFMVRHIMQAHGGTAEVQSEPGRGSCFKLVLPVVNP